ncbi:hypothetical protein [Flavobacterium psychrophilum]|uniref:hypothetical protein n=1 Tax=Flavobacterium psychrophilum TaxID=96345 RepID=UPI000B7C4EDF|nr:hypothetical protein [Flavobacterium psychrophilum]EKT3967194.1 hypothetical protein [Flavobacterium psychrophilum]EKT4520530.1 hypothetical protein [Flavobacterium psychrophilum]EKT4551999.1 hypothetical protein [Flavobacterium psychrophilum]MCB6070880.1 hypothetical protein [Flavobacterium psychrophilum]MCB6108163.1 hypothetical protein [Flavobacterium psychrophilum]
MSNIFSNIKERVLYFAENQEGNKQVFFKKIGMTYGNFTGKAKETPLNSNAIGNILLNYPKINLEWLLNGKGKMLKEVNDLQALVIEFDQKEKTILELELNGLKNENELQASTILLLKELNAELKYRISILEKEITEAKVNDVDKRQAG